MCIIIVIFFFFFFQAEDGIRDWSVTGVQTCALPISAVLGGDLRQRNQLLRLRVVSWGIDERGGNPKCAFLHGLGHEPLRSEERRVGKECRSRWSPYH